MRGVTISASAIVSLHKQHVLLLVERIGMSATDQCTILYSEGGGIYYSSLAKTADSVVVSVSNDDDKNNEKNTEWDQGIMSVVDILITSAGHKRHGRTVDFHHIKIHEIVQQQKMSSTHNFVDFDVMKIAISPHFDILLVAFLPAVFN